MEQTKQRLQKGFYRQLINESECEILHNHIPNTPYTLVNTVGTVVRFSLDDGSYYLTLGKEFYFCGCGWKVKKVKWTLDDMKWIVETSDLFDKLFGPDNFNFKNLNKCLVIPKASQPSFVYDHAIWEEQFKLPKVKQKTNPKARCSLEKSFSKVEAASTSGKKNASDIWVPKWGGFAYLQDTIVIKLTNACPIDNYLTILYLYLKEHSEVLYQLSQWAIEEKYARCLNDVVRSFDDAAAGAGKVHWLQQFPKFNFTVSSTVDVWGSEQDMFVLCLASLMTTTLKTTCSSKDCPKQIQELNRRSIQILDGNVERIHNQPYLETLFNNWLSPPPKSCDVTFQHQPPPSAPTKTAHSQFVLHGNLWNKPLCCGGIRSSDSRQFSNGLPWVLPIFLGDLGQTDKLSGPDEIPRHL